MRRASPTRRAVRPSSGRARRPRVLELDAGLEDALAYHRGARQPHDEGRGAEAAGAEILGRYRRRTQDVDDAIVSAYVHGASTHDVGKIIAALICEQVGRATVSRVAKSPNEKVDAGRQARGYDSCPMDLSDFDEVAKLIRLPEDHVIGLFTPTCSKPAASSFGVVGACEGGAQVLERPVRRAELERDAVCRERLRMALRRAGSCSPRDPSRW